jgi:hypothetical protein
MITSDENRFKMLTTTSSVVLKYKEVWEDHVAFTAGVTALDAQMESIDEQAQIAAGNSGAANAKRLALAALGKAAEEIIGAVRAYATKNALPEIAAQVDYSPTDFIAGKARAVVSRANAVHAAANGVVAALADFGITPAKLTAFKKKIDAFDGVKTSPRESIVQRKAANELLPTLVRAAVDILNDQLDGLMPQFQDVNPNFYEEYFAARIIVDTHNGAVNTDKKAAVTPATDTPTPTPVPA